MSVELKNRAKELGVENADALTVPQLKKAIQLAEEKLVESTELREKASGLGIEVEGKTDEEVLESVTEAEELAAEIQAHARNAELLAILSEYLGITDIDSLTKEEVSALLEKKKADEALQLEELKNAPAADADKKEVVEEPKGKTTKSISVSGKDYVFASDAPAAFRYLGQHKTQEEWIADEDAIELMVAGNLSFLTLKK